MFACYMSQSLAQQLMAIRGFTPGHSIMRHQYTRGCIAPHPALLLDGGGFGEGVKFWLIRPADEIRGS
jgi:hypothetical protein